MPWLVIIVVLSAFMEVSSVIKYRFTVGGVPINYLEVCFILAYGFLLLSSKVLQKGFQALLRSVFYPNFLLLALVATWASINGARNGCDPYEIAKDARPMVFMILSYFYTVSFVRSGRTWNLITALIVVGGLGAMIRVVTVVHPLLYEATTYQTLQTGAASAGIEYATAFFFAAGIVHFRVLKSRMVTWSCLVFCVVSGVAAFNLTSYLMLALLPGIAVLLAPVPITRKIVLIGGTVMGALVISGGLFLAWNTWSGKEKFDLLADQIFVQLRDLQGSGHFQIRRAGWEGTISSLNGLSLLTGNGFGTRNYIPFPGYEEGILVEAAYAQCLNYTGVAGLAALIWLNLRMVIVAVRVRRSRLSQYQRAMMLALAVYGAMAFINGCVHSNLLAPVYTILYGVSLGLVEIMRRSAYSDLRGRNASAETILDEKTPAVNSPNASVHF